MKLFNIRILSLIVGISYACPMDTYDLNPIQTSGIKFSTREEVESVVQRAHEGDRGCKDFLINRIYFHFNNPKSLNLDIKKIFNLRDIILDQLLASEIYFIYAYDAENIVDKDKLISYTLQKAESGNPEWQNLAGYFIKSREQEDADKQGIKWYKLAADQGYNLALCNLGQAYQHGVGVKKNSEKGTRCYTQASNQGFAHAQVRLALQYQSEGCSEKAIELYEKAVAQGHPEALRRLGLEHDHNQDFDKAIKFYTLASNQGDSPSQSNLGFLYHFNKIDYEKAIEYYTLAANQGDAAAQCNLGQLYEDIKKDLKKSLEYYTLAANQGNGIGQMGVGRIYLNGLGVKKDQKKAKEYFTLAANKGYLSAIKQMGELCLKAGDIDEAIKWYTQAANTGDLRAKEDLKVIEQSNKKILRKKKKSKNQPQNILAPKAEPKEPQIKTKDQEIYEEADKLFKAGTDRVLAFKKYIEAKKLGNEEANKFLEHFYSGGCRNRDVKHKKQHHQFKMACEELENGVAVQEKKEVVSKKARRKAKSQVDSTPELSVDNKQEVIETPQVTIEVVTPFVELKAPSSLPAAVEEPVVPVIETQTIQTVLTPAPAQDSHLGVNKEKSDKTKNRRPLLRVNSDRDLRRKDGSEDKVKSDKKKQLKTLSLKNKKSQGDNIDSKKEVAAEKLTPRPSLSRTLSRNSLKDHKEVLDGKKEEEQKHPSLSRTPSQRDLKETKREGFLQRRNTVAEFERPPYVGLIKLLSNSNLRNQEDIQLTESVFFETLDDLQAKGLITWRQGDNKIIATVTEKVMTTRKAEKPKSMTIHTHNYDRPWVKKSETLSDFLDLVAYCHRGLERRINNISKNS